MKSLIFSAAVAVLAASPALAQSTDGALSGTSSTGTFDVNVTVVPMVSIRGLDAVNLTIDPAQIAGNFGTTTENTQFCVYSNVTTAGSYNVQVTGNASGDTANPYGLTGANGGATLGHTVGYFDNGNYSSTGATFMRNSIVRPSINTRNGQARATNLDCTNDGLGGSNSSIRVGIRNPVALAAVADTYTGTLSVTVSVP